LNHARDCLKGFHAWKQQNEPKTMDDLLNCSFEAVNADNEGIDPSFELDSSIQSDTHHQSETFYEEWVVQLSRDDKYLLAMFLQCHLCKIIGKGDTEASELAGLMIGKSDRTIRAWRDKFYNNNCKIPNSEQGCYQHSGVLWQNEMQKVCNDKMLL